MKRTLIVLAICLPLGGCPSAIIGLETASLLLGAAAGVTGATAWAIECEKLKAHAARAGKKPPEC